MAAAPNNGIGVAGTCWHCPLAMAAFCSATDQGTMDIAARSLTEAADKGVQVASMSFGAADECPGAPGQWGNTALCSALDNYTNRDIAFTAASGNDMIEVELPANHQAVAAIGATATDGTHWERLGCPNSGALDSECGSNYSQDPEVATLDLVAPGQFVLSTVFTGLGYPKDPPYDYPDTGCGDQFPYDGYSGNDSDGYGSCTGTSMSSPYVAGVLGLLRTANPLLTRWQLLQVLTETASGSGVWDQYLGYGVPDAAAA
ncbi:MAG: S8 family serine peptidase, partial [bacterium]|nr:S8 family serine peptidase [bacterium]